MPVIKVANKYFDASECWVNKNEYERWNDDGYERVIRTQVVVKTPGINIKEHVDEWEMDEWKKIHTEDYHDADEDVPRLGIRSYATSTIGEQTPLGYFEEWHFPNNEEIRATMTSTSNREPGYSEMSKKPHSVVEA